MLWLASAACLCGGAMVVWALYWRALREYVREGDHYAAEVTLVAMFGSFLPFLGFAMMVHLL